MDIFPETFKQTKAPWLSRDAFPIFGSTKNLLAELFKNFHDYGNSPYAALGATEHICGHDSGKVKLIKDAKQQLSKTLAASKRGQVDSNKEMDITNISKEEYAQILLDVSTNAWMLLQKLQQSASIASEMLQKFALENPQPPDEKQGS